MHVALFVAAFAVGSCSHGAVTLRPLRAAREGVRGHVDVLVALEIAANKDVAKSVVRGMSLAVSGLNEAGGVEGNNLVLRVVDLATPSGTEDFLKLTEKNPVVIVGDFDDSRQEQIADLRRITAVPVITLRMGKVASSKGVYVFHSDESDYGRAIGSLVTKHRWTRLVLVFNYAGRKSAAMLQIFGGMVAVLNASNYAWRAASTMHITGPQAISARDAIGLRNADAIVVFDETAGVSIASRIRALNVDVPIIGPPSWTDQDLATGMGASNTFVLREYCPATPRAHDFEREYAKRFGLLPDANAATGYDAISVVATAIQRGTGQRRTGRGGELPYLLLDGEFRGEELVSGGFEFGSNRRAKRREFSVLARGRLGLRCTEQLDSP